MLTGAWIKSVMFSIIITLTLTTPLQSAHNKILADNPNPPANAVRLIFVHHSTGGNWLSDEWGKLGLALKQNNYYVSDVCYGWGVNTIGDRTDIGNWWEWFRDPENSQTYLGELYHVDQMDGQYGEYSRLATNPDPEGENKIIMFKSCFPNSTIYGDPNDPVPNIADNPIKGESAGSESYTVANIKGLYIDLLEYFKTRQDKLFIIITAPPLIESETSSNARAVNLWLVDDWLKNYPFKNVFVFDFFNCLTTNGGNSQKNDLGAETGNHHRWWNGAVQHTYNGSSNLLAYPSDDDHPNPVGNAKTTAEFLPLLNVAYNQWSGATSVETQPDAVPVPGFDIVTSSGTIDISYQLPKASTIDCRLFSLIGESVAVKRFESATSGREILSLPGVIPGCYLLVIKTHWGTEARPLLID